MLPFEDTARASVPRSARACPAAGCPQSCRKRSSYSRTHSSTGCSHPAQDAENSVSGQNSDDNERHQSAVCRARSRRQRCRAVHRSRRTGGAQISPHAVVQSVRGMPGIPLAIIIGGATMVVGCMYAIAARTATGCACACGVRRSTSGARGDWVGRPHRAQGQWASGTPTVAAQAAGRRGAPARRTQHVQSRAQQPSRGARGALTLACG